MTNAELCRELKSLYEASTREPLCYYREKCHEAAAAIEALEKERGEQERSLEACRDELNRIRAALRDTFTEW